MIETTLPIREEVKRIKPYNSGLTLEEVRDRYNLQRISKLASNENPLGTSPRVEQCLSAPLDLFRLYPDPQGRSLGEAISDRLGISSQQIVLGNGSEDLIGVLCRTVVRQGDIVTTLYPSFPLHEDYATLMGGHVQRIEVQSDLSIDLEALLEAIQRKPRLVMFSNPMNPVGAWLNAEQLKRVTDSVSDETLLVIDEAYVEYATGPDYTSALSALISNSKNWVILRTFSKAYGLAGVRIGYAVTSSARLASYLNRVRTPFNTNAIAQKAAKAALLDDGHVARTVQLAVDERERVATALKARGYAVAPSRGNFLFFDCGENSQTFSEKLLAKGVIVKPWMQNGYETFIRVTIGLYTENEHFLDALASDPRSRDVA